MADKIRAAAAIQRPAIEGLQIQNDLQNLIERFAIASLNTNPRTVERLRREIIKRVAKKYYPTARDIGKASAEPILKALGGEELVKKGSLLRGRILNNQRLFQRKNLLSFRAELQREVGTLSGSINTAFARAARDRVARKTLIADLVAADKGELKQLDKARKRVVETGKKVAAAEKRVSVAGKRSATKAKRQLREARKLHSRAKSSVKSTRSFLARFETRVQAAVRDGVRREVGEAQMSAFVQAGFKTFTWVTVSGEDACPSCVDRHGRTKPLAQWRGDEPRVADTFCDGSCRCQLVPDKFTEGNASILKPIKMDR